MSHPRLDRIRDLARRFGLSGDWVLLGLAVAIGLIMGVAALAFIAPINWAEEALEHAVERSSGAVTFAILALPIAGALLTGLLLHFVRIRLRGHGVSVVIYSVSREQSRLPFALGVRQWFGSTFTIASGGSAGPEGPIVTIGAVIGSGLGRLLRVDAQQTTTLLGCGAAAGLASVFNAPMAGIFFVLEVLLRDFSIRTFTPIVVAAVIAAATTQTILGGNEPLFGIGFEFFRDRNDTFTVLQAPLFIGLGVVCGLVATAFFFMLRRSEALFEKMPGPGWTRPMVGASLLVLGGWAWLAIDPASGLAETESSLPPFYGNGYPLIRILLDPDSYVELAVAGSGWTVLGFVGLLVALAIAKAVATCLTLSSGGAGGLFAPSLVLGAVTGAAFGELVNATGVMPAANPAHFALVGMAAMVAATTHAPLTGIILVYEITRNYALILPLMLTAVFAVIVGRIVFRESVYTAELRALGVRVGTMSDLTVLRRMTVRGVPSVPPVLVRENDGGQRLLDLSERFSVNDFVVTDDDGRYLGMVTGADLRQALVYREAIPLLQVGEIERTDLPTVVPDETLDVVLDKFSANDVESLAIVSPTNGAVSGVITRSRLMREYQRELEKDN